MGNEPCEDAADESPHTVIGAYQCLNVVIVLGDTIAVSGALPGGKTYGIQGAPAQNEACCERTCTLRVGMTERVREQN